MTAWKLFWTVFLYCVSDTVLGQGRLLLPPGRSSMWRVGYDTPINNNDNALTCGGLQHRWETNQGKCGVCGDPWESRPRDNEAGGLYAREIITEVYISGTLLEAIVDVANANGGYFEFRLCANNNLTSPVKQECLSKGLLTMEDGISTRFDTIRTGLNRVILKLPEGLHCDQCVLQWKYRSADQFGCDTVTGREKTCGFGHSEMQTEYFACADIAIYTRDRYTNEFPNPNGDTLDETHDINISSHNDTTKSRRRSKRAIPNSHYIGLGVPYNPTYSSGMDFRAQPTTTQFFPEQSGVQWLWNVQHSTGPGRFRRRTPIIPTGNRHLNGILLSAMNGAGRVRSSFNLRRNGILFPNGGTRQTIVAPDPFMVKPMEINVRAHVRPASSFSIKQVSMSNTLPTISMNTNPRKAISMNTLHQQNKVSSHSRKSVSLTRQKFLRNIDSTRAHRKFLDPLSPNVSGMTQKVLSRSNYKPTKQCQHCPFDQCLDDKLRIDHLFPGLFDSPTQFFECKRFERVFTIGNYDVLQEGLPNCQHPRFKRQLSTYDDDEYGCCATRPQVILPLTVEAENDTFSVVQLGDAKKQFIVQGICGKSNTTSCTVCSAENNFQWVLVYDPRVNTKPPVAFVPVKFPHYCRCYNYMTMKG